MQVCSNKFQTQPPQNKNTISNESMITNDLIKFLVTATVIGNISWNENKPCSNYTANYKNINLELQLNTFKSHYTVEYLKIDDYVMDHKELEYLAKSIYNVSQRKLDLENFEKETEILNKLKQN